ncbi:MAG: hypothetical protein HC836_32610 [Richelia sp. RM2_1_2]|nr:hypothetical protein [Richelia sp. SM2_1_7]NJM19971.1 hypothetical protein [Richelia sp. SM1_7_0]NJN13738.1 hypothetical protein [Richelia sp. RM1_1_1]NJO28885.1 hypothetical protein [Richelia sp. SL_2_1]NJO62797.1 hypothetical protein [Richelia sp. RM2_1_2]
MSQTKTVKGITFQYGENESQRYWEHVTEKETYMLISALLNLYVEQKTDT